MQAVLRRFHCLIDGSASTKVCVTNSHFTETAAHRQDRDRHMYFRTKEISSLSNANEILVTRKLAAQEGIYGKVDQIFITRVTSVCPVSETFSMVI